MEFKTESEARIALAKSQNKILNSLFRGVSESEFNPNVDLSEISSTRLKDFWLYTTGFLGLLNYESEDNLLPRQEIEDMLKGKFHVKTLTSREVSKMLQNAGIRESRAGFSQSYELYSIQDGVYKIAKNTSASRIGYQNRLELYTSPLEVYTDNPYFDEDPVRELKLVRNCLAHGVPYVNGSAITLLSGNDDIVVSKMWLRGFAETFARIGMKTNENQIHEKLLKELPFQGNYIENEKDIDQALSAIKDCFDDETKKNYYRINNFIKTRLRYEPDFFKKSFDEKVKKIAAICANNPHYLTSASETICPSIVYSLQQIIAKELANRGEDAYLTDEDLNLEELNRLEEKRVELMDRCDAFDKKNPTIKTQLQSYQNKRLTNELMALYKKYEELQKSIETKRKLECSNMDLLSEPNLSVLPVEVAVQIVWLMAFNNLVTSGFYEDLLAETDFSNLNSDQKKFFDSFDLSKLNITYYNKKVDKLDASEKSYILSCMRNALCHGLIEFKYQPVKQDEKPTYKDTTLIFNPGFGTVISGRLEDFLKLFGSGGFTKNRDKKICTGKIVYYTEDGERVVENNNPNAETNEVSSEEPTGGQPGDEE